MRSRTRWRPASRLLSINSMKFNRASLFVLGVGLAAASLVNLSVSHRKVASVGSKADAVYRNPLSLGAELRTSLLDALGERVGGSRYGFERVVSPGSIPPAHSREEFCKNAKNPDYFKTLLFDSENHNSSSNSAGGLGTGLCWWHSEFQRSATYLAVYRPDLPRPDEAEARALINDIMTKQGVVEIPGFNNFREFSGRYYSLVEKMLTAGEVTTSVFELGFVKGLIGSSGGADAKLAREMDDLYDEVVNKKGIAFQVLQMPGVEAHAWIVLDMRKTEAGYDLAFVDSNMSGEVGLYHYRRGEPMRMYLGDFAPHTYKSSDIKFMRYLQEDYCRNGTTATSKRASSGFGGIGGGG